MSKAKSNVVSLNSAPYLLDVNLILLAPTNVSAATSAASEDALTPAAVAVPAAAASAFKIPFFNVTFTSAGAPVAVLSSCFAFDIISSISS